MFFRKRSDVAKGLTAEVVVLAHIVNSSWFSIIVLLFCKVNLEAEGRAIETTVALPWRYRSGAPVVVSAQFRCVGGAKTSSSGAVSIRK